MKISTKVLLSIILVWSLMFTATYFGSTYILQKSYLKLEDATASNDLERSHGAIDQMETFVATVTSSWSLWDDAYQFAIKPNQKFIDSAFSVAVIAGVNVDMVLVYGNTGNTIFTRALNTDRTEEAPLPRGISDAFKPDGELWNLIYKPQINSAAQGLYQIKEGILILASHSILTSTGAGPPHGTMILASYFTDDTVKKLRRITALDLDFYPLAVINSDASLKSIYNSLINSHTDRIDKISAEKLLAYSAIKDINNNPIAMIKIVLPRSIYKTGVDTLTYFNTSFIISCVFVAILLFILLQIFVINRLKNINNKIIEVRNTKDLTIKIPDTGSDELSSVGRVANQMLDIVRQYTQEKEVLLKKRSQQLDSENEYTKKLQETEHLTSSIINSMPSILIIADINLDIYEINNVAAKEIGLHSAEVKNKSIFDYFPYLTPFKEKLLNSMNNDKTEAIDKILHKNKDGSNKYYSAILYPLSKSHGQARIAIRIDDITDHERLQERLMQNDKLASIGVLTAGVAHEINNPINFVSSAISPLKHNIADIFEVINKYSGIKSRADAEKELATINETKKELNIDYVLDETMVLLDGIKNGASRTASIVKDLKSFTRLDEDTLKKSDIKAIIDSVLTLLRHRCKDKIDIIKEYESIPDIACYPGRINQMLMNIITNAIDAIPAKGEIKIKLSQENGHLVMSIKDSGIGIKEENINKIFDPFFTTKDVGAGTGMGLSIARSIILDHGGTIDLKSSPGHGTEFIVTLPIEQRT